MRLTDLADGLRAHGLTVVEEPGWKTRGASGGAQMRAVRGVLWHHDVAPAKGTYPLRTMLRSGRPGLSGPLCHLGFDRDGVVHVVGAGKANHAGKGIVRGVPRDGGNVYLIGIEMTSTGRGDWTDAQLRQMPKLGAALSRMYGLTPDQHWGHCEYTTRKTDPYGLPGGMPGLRSRIRAALAGGATATATAAIAPPGPVVAALAQTQAALAELGYEPGAADGVLGPRTRVAVTAFQTDAGITPDGVPGPTTRSHLEDSMTKLDDISRKLDAVLEYQQGQGRGRQAVDRILGILPQRRDAKGNPARVLDTLDGDTLRQDIRDAAARLSAK